MTHVSSVHSPMDVRIYHKECITLTRAGYRVTLVAPSPRRLDLGPVTHVPMKPPRGRIQRMTLGVLRTAVAAWRTGADVYHLHDPELIPLGVLLRVAGRRVIYDAHEDLSAQVRTKPWIPASLRSMAAWLSRLLERIAGRTMSAIVAATPQIARGYGRQAYVVQNFPWAEEFELGKRATTQAERSAAVVYVGGITEIRGAIQMVEAVGMVEPSLDVRLDLAGPFEPPSLLQDCARLSGWKRVRYRPWAERAQVGEILSAARVGLVVFQPAPNHVSSYPTKLFEYMAAGLPVIASDFPLWREIVVGGGFGLVVDPRDPRAVAGAIERLVVNTKEAQEMGQRGRRAVAETLNWDTQAVKLEDAYRFVLGDRDATCAHCP